MSKLSQAEIDALIAGMLSGEIDQATLDAALNGSAEQDEAAPPAEPAAAGPADAAAADAADDAIDLGPITQSEVDAALRAAGKGSLIFEETTPPAPAPGLAPPPPAQTPQVTPAVFPTVAAAPRPAFPPGSAGSILMDLELSLTAELVRTRMRLNQLLGLQPGSVLELDRRANEPVDIIINGHQMMKAKVVTLGENYGVQITETRLQQPA